MVKIPIAFAIAAASCMSAASLAAPPASPAFHCSYRIALSFANGAKLVQDGQADLPAGTVKHRAASLAYDTPISAAVLDDWNCLERPAPRAAGAP